MKKPSRPQVSDHAVLRFLERVKGVNVNAVRRRIGKAVTLGDAFPDATGVIHGGHVYKLRNGVVTTVLPIRGKRTNRKPPKGRVNGKG
ncbi:hypothetical protein K3555_11935 [Leisingera sp. M527]|uniref:hypothetical protein n=1 Tax=Leisingera sp. M527 TaxID=2867014 RepID=UPI0021A36ACD|nr:hypothetical protein [Leisingera sp. M527]UWQ31320.1 hypothetical protein K3555_11935 [Leisingera sp. M527]